MKRLVLLMLGLATIVIAANVTAQPTDSGDIVAHIDSIIGDLPGSSPGGDYLQPGSSSRALWREIIQAIMGGDYAAADSIGADINYEVVAYTDTEATPNKLYYILQRTSASTSRYWGTFVFNPDPARPRLVIECPHPVYDLKTGRQGFHAFRKAGARAYFCAGTHRCNGLTYSSCDGTTSACSVDPEAYRYSDQAHVVLSTFQLTTEEILVAQPDLIAIQPHGYAAGSGDPDIIMSNGTRFTPSYDWLLDLRDNLLLQDPTLTFKVAHVDLDWTYLIARTNCQGRLLNNSSDPCDDYATEASGHFIHLEQRYTGLRDTQANWDKLANAIIATFPPVFEFATAQNGSWTDPDTWAGGVIPDASDDVLISAGHTVSVDDTLAQCRDLAFSGNDALIDMNADSRLTIYGDMTLFSESHNVFSAGWSSDSAFVRLAGPDPQTLSGWSTSGGSTSFRDLVIDKDSGVVVQTSGAGMRLAVQNSLEIIAGSLVLEPGDDLEARWASSGNFTNNQNLTITVHPDGEFRLIEGDGTHFIRSATASTPIGPMIVQGNVEFYDASSYDISISGITIDSGGQVKLGTGLGSSTYGPELNVGTITVNSGGALYGVTTSDIWFPGSEVVLNDGGVYKTSSSSTVFPPTLVNNGRVRYQRNPETATTDQEVVDTDYRDIEFSFNGNGTKKLWILDDDRLVTDSFEVNNSAELVMTADNPQSVTVNGTLRLVSGSLDNSDTNVSLTLADGALISRATGEMLATPVCAGVIDVRYTSSQETVTTGLELPAAGSSLRDLTVTSVMGVQLGGDAAVNGQLLLEDSTLITGESQVILGPAASLVESPGHVVQGNVIATRLVTQGNPEAFGNIGLELTAADAAPSTTSVLRVTGTPQLVNGGLSIHRYVDISPVNNSGLGATVTFHYADAELNGNSETDLAVWASYDSGTNWTELGGSVDTAANTLTVTGVDQLGRLTLADAGGGGCCHGVRGNVDNDPEDVVSLGDLTVLIDHLFVSFADLECWEEANVDASQPEGSNSISLGDLTVLIDALFVSFQDPPACP